jgi:hypothetical protein
MQVDIYPRWFQKIPTKYWPSSPIKSGASFYAKIGLGYILITLTFLLWEWLAIGYFAIPSVVANYHFGSAAMLGEGGPTYASAAIYAQASLEAAVFPMMPLAFLFAVAIVKNNFFYQTIAWASLIATLLVGVLGN